MAELPVAAQSGRGLHVVDALADEWGVELVPDDGKVVWVELDVVRTPVPASV